METRRRWRWIAAGVALASALLGYIVWKQAGSDSRPASSGNMQVTAYQPARSASLPTVAREAGPGFGKNPCGEAMAGAFNARALTLSGRQDARSQLAYALAVPFEPGFDFERAPPDVVQRVIDRRHAEAQRALLRAAALAPDKPEILFLAAAQCGSGEACRWRDSSLHSALQFEDYALDEARAMQAALEAAGRWPPPADWLPADETARSLIQTGRRPPKPTR